MGNRKPLVGFAKMLLKKGERRGGELFVKPLCHKPADWQHRYLHCACMKK
jgi:hypothetical protein